MCVRCLVRSVRWLAVAASLSACSSMEQFVDKVTDIGGEKPLPGARRSAFDSNSYQSEGAKVSIPGPRDNSDWALPGGEATNAPGNLALSSGGGWKTSSGWMGGGVSRAPGGPVVHQGLAFVATQAGGVKAYDVTTGNAGWSASISEKLGESAGGGIAAAGGRLYLAAGTGILAAFDASSGNRLWERSIGATLRSAPTVVGGKVYVITTANVVLALKADDGSELWRYAGPGDSAGLISGASAAVNGNLVVAPMSSGQIVALDAGSGKLKWQQRMSGEGAVAGVGGLGDVAARPVIAGGIVYAASVNGKFIALRESDGKTLWERDVAAAYTPAVAGNAVFVLSLSGQLTAFDRTTGKIAWSTPLPSEVKERWAGPVLANSRLWAVSSTGRLVSVDAVGGTVSEASSIGEAGAGSPIVASGRLIIATGSGGLIAQ